MIFALTVLVIAVVAGMAASISGFGIGSLLTPLLALRLGTQLAVAAVSIPHLIGTSLRFLMLKEKVDKRIFLRFGLLSALGSVTGALLHSFLRNPALDIIFGILLIFAGSAGLTGLTERMRFGRKTAWAAGMLSGLLGGLVGNQGGIRSAALLGFDVSKESFVATATAIGLIVDGARMPVYLAYEGRELWSARILILPAIAGVIAGTFLGTRLLRHISERLFLKLLSGAITVLGVYMLIRGWRS